MSKKGTKNYSFDLTPREEGDKKKRSAIEESRIAKAVEYHLKKTLKDKNLSIDEPGLIDPQTVEVEAAKKIAEETNPQLFERAAKRVRVREQRKITSPDGTVVETITEIEETRSHTKLNVETLSKVISRITESFDKVTELATNIYGLAVRVGNYFGLSKTDAATGNDSSAGDPAIGHPGSAGGGSIDSQTQE
ncbi:MAG: hypothetical protein H7144_07620 [Burkholderiales bacterium]|nr:hypothetical protein [Phycisphaerae bacterium]